MIPSNSEKVMYLKFFLVVLAYGFNGTTYTGIPFLFYRSKLSCLDEHGQAYSCTLEEACDNPNGYTQVSDYEQIYSITNQFNLYCDRKIIEAWILTLANFAKIVAYFILCLFPVAKKVKELFIYACITVIGVQLLILNWIQTTYMFIIAFCVWYLFFTLFYGLVYTYFVENFPPSLAKYGPAFLNTSWPGMMIIYIGYTFQFGTWENSLVDFTGIPLLFLGIIGLSIQYLEKKNKQQDNINYLDEYLISENSSQVNQDCRSQSDVQKNNQVKNHSFCATPPRNNNKTNIENNSHHHHFDSKYDYESHNQQDTNNHSEEKQKFQFQKNYQFLYKDKNVRNNFLIWSLGWSCNGICYVGCYLQLNTLKGDLFFNSFSTTLCEVAAGLIGTFLVFKYNNNLKNIIIGSFFTIGIAFVSCMFMEDPNSTNKSDSTSPSILITLLYLFPIIVAKISYEINWTLLVTYQKSVIPLEYHQAQFSCSSLISVIFCDLTPFYKYFAESIGFNTFVGFGLVCLWSAYSSRKYVEIGQESQIGSNINLNQQHYEMKSKSNEIELLDIKQLSSQQL